MRTATRSLLLLVLLPAIAVAQPAARGKTPMAALVIDGQSNHDWKATTPLVVAALESSGLFTVTVATTPARGQDMSSFKPAFAGYKVVISNYNGEPWPKETQDAFVKYVRGGGGFVPVHAANNAFSDWPEYNEIIGLGGWGNRTEAHGPYVRWKDGKITRDTSPGPGGGHGAQHAFVIDVRDSKHPITRGLPARWMHVKDELYDRLRGPAKKLTVLATALSDPSTKGTGLHEPLLMTVSYGRGRVFHTALGHGVDAMKCAGFVTTLQRGAEWAATGRVTQKIPTDLPTAEAVSVRP